ncbi:hypothetical protein RHGRI_033958 [Rhododendron griersonianum]|uniref:Uncharacterized protein n=1 Tax=Rhododendron griersonianum TaxID=479676 RepID=A0AAV6I4C3_9ERIC|nr:hypothetical protein RHGRI_033958 [Rhododendron griersonianum]
MLGTNWWLLNSFSPGYSGCKALHPKACQIAEMNPEVQFLRVNYEEHKSMCYSLNVHVLPITDGTVCWRQGKGDLPVDLEYTQNWVC